MQIHLHVYNVYFGEVSLDEEKNWQLKFFKARE